MQRFVEAVIWDSVKKTVSKYQNSINDLYTLKGMTGLFQPKYLKMMSLEKLLLVKQELEGVVATLETYNRKPSQKVPIPNSLKIIKVLLLALESKPEFPKLLGNKDLYSKKTILDPETPEQVQEFSAKSGPLNPYLGPDKVSRN